MLKSIMVLTSQSRGCQWGWRRGWRQRWRRGWRWGWWWGWRWGWWWGWQWGVESLHWRHRELLCRSWSVDWQASAAEKSWFWFLFNDAKWRDGHFVGYWTHLKTQNHRQQNSIQSHKTSKCLSKTKYKHHREDKSQQMWQFRIFFASVKFLVGMDRESSISSPCSNYFSPHAHLMMAILITPVIYCIHMYPHEPTCTRTYPQSTRTHAHSFSLQQMSSLPSS